MPSDLVWVALISSGATLAASFLTARLTSKSTQQQIDAQTATTKQQIDHQQVEARLGRVIEARRQNLTALSESLSELIASNRALYAGIVTLDIMDGQGQLEAGNPARTRLQTQITGYMDDSMRHTQALGAVNLKISDRELVSQAAAVLADLVRVSQGTADVADVQNYEEVKERIKDAHADPVALNLKILEVAKRIEELLSGDELT